MEKMDPSTAIVCCLESFPLANCCATISASGNDPRDDILLLSSAWDLTTAMDCVRLSLELAIDFVRLSFEESTRLLCSLGKSMVSGYLMRGGTCSFAISVIEKGRYVRGTAKRE